jgi:hypothetical protein
MHNGTHFRQGDVLIVRVNAIPEQTTPIAREHGKIVLAHGEVTGHSHAIADREAEFYSAPDTSDRFLRIMAASGVELRHEEHATIALPPGNYAVRIQREYQPHDLPRRVGD